MLDLIPYFLGASLVMLVKWIDLREMCSHVAHWYKRKEWVLFVPSLCLTLATLGCAALYVLGASYGLAMLGVAVPLQSLLLGAAAFGIGFYSPPLIKHINHGEMLPRGYGVAWMDYGSGRLTCMPVPINVVVRWCRVAWVWLKYAGMTLPATPSEAYDAGYRKAIEDSQS